MALWVDLLRALTLLNVLLLGGLSYVWVRNYARFRSKHTMGLALFAVLLLLENLMTGYVFAVDPQLSTWVAEISAIAQRTMTGLKFVEFLGLVVLTYTTWD